MINKWPLVSIVISNFNGLSLNLIIDSLSSVLSCDYPNFEVLMIDNASTDRSIQAVREKFGKNKKLRIIQNPVNMYSQGLNLGWENSTGEFVAFFNNDIEFKKGYFQKIITVFKKNPDVYLIQGKILYFYDHKTIDSAGETMDIYGNPITIGAWEKDRGQFEKVTEILSASGSASVVRKDVLTKIGKFDEDYGIGYEDMDLALRIRLKGFKVLYLPSAVIYHKRGKTDLSSIVRIKVRWHFNKNRLATMIKDYPLPVLLTSLPATLMIYLLASIWETVIKGKIRLGLTRLSAVWWVILNMPKLVNKRKLIRNNIKKRDDEHILSLISHKSLLGSFRSFVKS